MVKHLWAIVTIYALAQAGLWANPQAYGVWEAEKELAFQQHAAKIGLWEE